MHRLPPKGATVALDFETVSLETPQMVIPSYAWRDENGLQSEAFYIEGHDPKQFLEEFLATVGTIVFHNFKFDAKVFDYHGVDAMRLMDKVVDTLIMAKIQAPDRMDSSMEGLAHLVNRTKMSYEASQLAGGEEFLKYARNDAEITLLLYEYFRDYFKTNGLLTAHYLESEIVFLTYIMERNGILVDTKRALELQSEVDASLDELHRQLSFAIGTPINFNSSKQLINLLHNTLGLPTLKEFRTPKGSPQTNRPAIEALISLDTTITEVRDFLTQLLAYKKLFKLRTSFLSEKFFSMISSKGRIHPTFNSMGTETGRYSSSNPNQQQISRNSDDGSVSSRLRSIYCAPEGHDLICVDFSQIELRVLAHFSQEPAMLAAFAAGEDLHQVTADMLNITRSHAKNINFGLAYGLGATGLARNAKIPVSKASVYLRDYYEQFRRIKPWKEAVVAYAYKNGGIRTISGRFRNLKKFIRFEDGSFERRAVNTLIQGSSADILKFCMARIFRHFKNDKLKMIMQVHDELVFESPNEHTAENCAVIQDFMENTFKLTVPLEAVPNASHTWLEAKG
jgi:DNA polymerase-1